jgi:hypothetical protein
VAPVLERTTAVARVVLSSIVLAGLRLRRGMDGMRCAAAVQGASTVSARELSVSGEARMEWCGEGGAPAANSGSLAAGFREQGGAEMRGSPGLYRGRRGAEGGAGELGRVGRRGEVAVRAAVGEDAPDRWVPPVGA